jgi:hypothetical protein
MKTQISTDDLYDLFVAAGVTYEEIEAMDPETITRQVAELRSENPDDLDLTNDDIAQMIVRYASASLATCLSRRQPRIERDEQERAANYPRQIHQVDADRHPGSG